MSKEKIEMMQKEVDSLAKQIEEICKDDIEVNQLYLGTQIYFSPLQHQMDLMFLGINPGGGAYTYSGRKPRKTEPLEKSEYETERYALQEDWNIIFKDKEINRIDLLYNGFKTNCSFIATKDSNSLKKLNRILKEKYELDLNKKQAEFIKLLISYVGPKLIICEGFSAFATFRKMYTNNEFQMTDESEVCKIAYLNGKLPVLGFKRGIDSRFKDLDNVVDTLIDFLEE